MLRADMKPMPPPPAPSCSDVSDRIFDLALLARPGVQYCLDQRRQRDCKENTPESPEAAKHQDRENDRSREEPGQPLLKKNMSIPPVCVDGCRSGLCRKLKVMHVCETTDLYKKLSIPTTMTRALGSQLRALESLN